MTARAVVGGVLVAVMAVTLAWLLLRDPVPPQPAVAPQVTTTTILSSPAPTTAAGVAATTTTTPLPATTTDASQAPIDETSVIEALDAALAAWGRFIVSGDMGELAGHLVEGGPQWQQLAGEAETLATEPIGLPAYTFDLDLPQVIDHSDGMAVVVTELIMSRPGEPPQRFDWAITLQEIGGQWMLYTVADS